jgi:hypothetical protein
MHLFIAAADILIVPAICLKILQTYVHYPRTPWPKLREISFDH